MNKEQTLISSGLFEIDSDGLIWRVAKRHGRGVKDDNRPENLELATYSEQRHHAIQALGARHHDVRGSKHPKTHLLESDVLRIRDLRENGMMLKEIAARYAMKPKAISAICNRRTWKHI